jgi:tetratricopeptide (TPR) repeat protein
MKRSRVILIGGLTLGIVCLMFSPGALPAVGGNMEYNNNYFDHLTDWQQLLLKNNEEHHLRKATMQWDSGNPHLVEYIKQDLQYMLVRWPNHPKALQMVADIAIQTKDSAYAVKWFEKAIDAFPSVYQSYTLYGIYLYRTQKYDNATVEFRKAVELNPNSSETNYNLGLALAAEHKYEEANKYAQRAYGLGYPLDGLRKQLKEAKAWKPLAEENPQQATPDPVDTSSK